MKYLHSINSSEDYIYVMFRFDLLYLQLQPISFSLLFDSYLPPSLLNNVSTTDMKRHQLVTYVMCVILYYIKSTDSLPYTQKFRARK